MVGLPGGASVEELPFQLTKCLGLTRRIQDGPPPTLLHSTYREVVSQGDSSEESMKQRCVVSKAVSFEVSIAMKIYIVIFCLRTPCSLMGGYQPGSSRQLCYSEMLGILLGTA
jgi:hypothetical protein